MVHLIVMKSNKVKATALLLKEEYLTRCLRGN